jgi:hypothetical protein
MPADSNSAATQNDSLRTMARILSSRFLCLTTFDAGSMSDLGLAIAAALNRAAPKLIQYA